VAVTPHHEQKVGTERLELLLYMYFEVGPEDPTS
jgi:hypothetical protein